MKKHRMKICKRIAKMVNERNSLLVYGKKEMEYF